MSALALAALDLARVELTARVRGGAPGFGRFRGLRVDEYQHFVGLPLSPDPKVEGHPWCAAAASWCLAQAIVNIAPGVDYIPPPKTGGALHFWDTSPLAARTQEAQPGALFVLNKGKGRGHIGFVETVSPDGLSLATLEPDTDAAGSTTGDAWGTHFWQPSDGARGQLVGYLLF